MIQEEIREALKVALGKLGMAGVEPEIEHPTDLVHGDYATNVAMVAAKKLGEAPERLAGRIATEFRNVQHPMLHKMEVAGAGFINFYLTRGFFTDSISLVNENFGKNGNLKGQKILFEHSSPNLFKPFHIGHVMNNAVGESLSRLAKFSGADVTVISYPSDVSLGIGKALWALFERGVDRLEALATNKEKAAFLGECYTEGVAAFEKSERVRARVLEITREIYEGATGEVFETYELGKKITLEYFENITKQLGSTFDGYIFESEAGGEGLGLVRESIGSVFAESQGAVVYEGGQDGLHTRVFINQEGLPTYEAKDIGLLQIKFQKYGPDTNVLVTDNEQASYYEVVLSAAGKINKRWKENTVHITHGRMSLQGKKMSSRLGGVPLAEDMLDVVREELMERTDRELSDEDINSVAVGALKYAILKNAPGKNISFDPDSSLSFEGDSGPYLQYTYVRTKSLLEKAQKEGILPSTENAPDNTAAVERLLYRFPEVIEEAAREYAPQRVVTFLIELASAFNSFYASEKIVDANDKSSSYKLAITKAVGIAIKNGLWVLGIPTPERM